MSLPIRPSVLSMQPYSPGKPIEEVQRELGLTRVVKLASNENPLGPSRAAVEAVRKEAENLHIYPDAGAFALKEAIAARYKIARQHILTGNGSDEIIHLLGLITLESPENEVIVGDPSFVRYDATAQIADCRLVKVPLTSDLRHDLPAMAAKVNSNTKMLFVANPNNPTGTIVTREELRELLESVPQHVLVVLDEAYCEFAEHDNNFATSLEFVEHYPNVVGLRTFSKAYGLAGIRIGYGFASLEVVDAINRAKEPFNTNILAQVAAIAALKDSEHVEATVKNNKAGAKVITDALEKHGGSSLPTYANFVFSDLGVDTRPIFDALMREGVIVRPGDIFGCPTYLRISIGTQEENLFFAEALDRVMSAR